MDPQMVGLLDKALPVVGTLMGALVGGVFGWLNASTQASAQRQIARDSARRARRAQRMKSLIEVMSSRLGAYSRLQRAFLLRDAIGAKEGVTTIQARGLDTDVAWSSASVPLSEEVARFLMAEDALLEALESVLPSLSEDDWRPAVEAMRKPLYDLVDAAHLVVLAGERYVDEM